MDAEDIGDTPAVRDSEDSPSHHAARPQSVSERSQAVSQTSQRLYPIRSSGSSAASRLSSVVQQFDPIRQQFAPAYFVRPMSWYCMRLVRYQVTEVLDMWQVPVPWWRPNVESDAVDVESFLAPMSRTVWRVFAHAPGMHRGCARSEEGVFEIAQDPHGRWILLRMY